VTILTARVGRQSRLRPRDDNFFRERRTHDSSAQNKKLSQQNYDHIMKDWNGSREPTDANGVDLPLNAVVPEDWAHWRVRTWADLLPSHYDMSGCRFELESLTDLGPEEKIAVRKAREKCLKACRGVRAASI
jgi:hypothetical protein